MEDKLLQTMAADLGVSIYESETKAHYCCRVLYSAIACWIKAAATDTTTTEDTTTVTGTSRRHISEMCLPILSEMLKRYPDCKTWFDTESPAENAVSILRSRLLQHGDLVNVGFNTGMALSASGRVHLAQNLDCVKGALLNPDSFYSGIAVLNSTSKSENAFPEPIEPAPEWIANYLRAAWWQRVDSLDDGLEFFDPYRKSKNNQCWQSTLPRPAIGMVLARRATYHQNAHEYIAYRPDEKVLHRISPFLQEQGEPRRFMMGMRAFVGNPVPVRINRFSDHVAFQIRVHLPAREYALLEFYAWPNSRIEDRLNWDMPIPVWSYMERHMRGLGLQIMEEVHG